MTPATKIPEALVSEVRRGTRYLLTSHVNPDGDSVGSEIGLARMLRQLGKGATIWNRDATPQIYRVLPGSERIHTGEAPPAGYPDLYDGIVVLECPSLERTGLADQLGGASVLNIDHHLGNEHYGAVNWVEPSAPAVGEMVYRLAQALKLEIDETTANALYLTLVTDTGGFRFSNATPAAFEAAAALVRDGASPDTVARWLYESQPVAVVRLLGEMLTTLHLSDDGRVASVWLSRDMFERAGAAEGDAEGLIDHPRSIAGVEAVALFRELGEGRVKVSMRSRGAVDVERIARRFGGGGHHNAAGCTVEGERETLSGEVLAALREAVG